MWSKRSSFLYNFFIREKYLVLKLPQFLRNIRFNMIMKGEHKITNKHAALGVTTSLINDKRKPTGY